MTVEEMERAIEFLLERDTRFRDSIDGAKEIVRRMGEPRINIINDTHTLKDENPKLTDMIVDFEARAEADRQQLREAMKKVDAANEVTRSLAEEIARLTANTSQPVANPESKQT